MSAEGGRQLFGVVAQFATPLALVTAAERLRDERYTRWDCHSPFPVHGLDRAMGLRDTRLPWVVFGAGATGTATALLMQWWMNAVNYPINVAGKPLNSVPAQIPIAFELTVLFASLAAFVSLFAFNGLPRFYHPLFRNRRFKRVTTDGFFISVEAADPRFDVERTERLLRDAGAQSVEWLEA